MSSGPNYAAVCYDDILYSMINNFWEYPEYNNEEITYPSYDPYSCYYSGEESPPITYEFVCAGTGNDPFMFHPLSPTSSYGSGDNSSMSSEDCLSVLSSTADSVDIPLEWLENIEELPALDEDMLFEALELIENEPLTVPTSNLYNIYIPTMGSFGNLEGPVKVKDYCCIACEKYFNCGSGLKKHFRTKTHKKMVDEKYMQDPVFQPETWKTFRYSCLICGRDFGKEEQVVDHITEHQKAMCVDHLL